MSYGTRYSPGCLHCHQPFERNDVVVMGLRLEMDGERVVGVIVQPAHKACQETYDTR